MTVSLDPKELFSAKSEEEVSTILSNFFNLDTNPVLLQNGSTFNGNRMYQWEDQSGRKVYIGVDIQAYPFHLANILPTSNGTPRLVYSPLPAYISTSNIDAKTGLLLRSDY
ncbi:hypothetical protein JNUCC42_22335 [Brevibacterium sp. JNUCC-42]|nr:hypothetical protein JNUCC42_22335 [Brevibacterium sp. JNUCC-42]